MGGRRRTERLSEYRVELPEQIHADQLVLALGAAFTTPPRDRPPTLTAFAPRFLEQYARANRHKPRGVESKESHLEIHLKPLLGELHLDEIGNEQIQALKTRLADRSAKTCNNVLSTLSKMLKVAKEWGLIRDAPRVSLLKTVDPVPKFYDKAQYEKLVRGAAQLGPRQLVAILLGGDCGLRMGEIRALERTHLDYERRQIHVAQAITKEHLGPPKGNKTRFVPMTEAVTCALRNLLPSGCARVLVNDEREHLSEQNLRTWLSNSQRIAGLEVRGATHILRHTFCSHLAMAGEALLTIKELAGHVSERTTMRYMHLAPSEKGRAIESLERWRRKP